MNPFLSQGRMTVGEVPARSGSEGEEPERRVVIRPRR
jgi:hypothetical protein